MQKKSFLDEPLTLKEKLILKKYLEHYKSLDSCSRKPKTKMEQRFILVCRGELDPKTGIEIAYLKYRRSKAEENKIKIAKIDKYNLQELNSKLKLIEELAQVKYINKYRTPKREFNNYSRTQENSRQDNTSLDCNKNRSTVENEKSKVAVGQPYPFRLEHDHSFEIRCNNCGNCKKITEGYLLRIGMDLKTFLDCSSKLVCNKCKQKNFQIKEIIGRI